MKKNDILKKIKKDHIKPRSKWVFKLENFLIYAGFAVFILMGSFCFSFMIHIIADTEWQLYTHFAPSFLRFLLHALPFFWIIFLLTFLIVAFINYRHTKTGYKHNAFTVIGACVLSSIMIGTAIYAINIPQKADPFFEEKTPAFHRLINQKNQRWLDIENGFLAGKVISINDDYYILLQDREKKKWKVDIHNAKKPRPFEIKIKDKIKIMGEKKDKDLFEAHIILPWMRDPRMMPFKGER